MDPITLDVDAEGRPLLGAMLARLGLLPKEDLLRALDRQEREGGRIGTCLVEMGLVSETVLLAALGAQLGVPTVDGSTLEGVAGPEIPRLPERAARLLRAVPFARSPKGLLVAMESPRSISLVDQVRAVCGGPVVPHLALELRIATALAQHYRIELPGRIGQVLQRLERRAAAAKLYETLPTAGARIPGSGERRPGGANRA
ncbi:MAG: hypothetical protein IPJ17_01525 [Holophagales bacterium]|nr:MAG: hypothetical protein IPJ17_01525 [Holophagales bacterium]